MFNESALKNYFEIVSGSRLPRFQELKKQGKFEEKVKKAYSLMNPCRLCERRCGAMRPDSAGKCGASDLRVSSAFLHFGEESFFVPSYTIFFSACSLRCVFCQNYEISQLHEGSSWSVETLANSIDLQQGFAKNINFVGGSPTPFLPYIFDALNRANANLPVVWNSNFYYSEEAAELLSGAVDVYLSDWKYGNDKCAERLSDAKNYCSIVERNHLLAFNDAELVIRHLVLPNHLECCTKPILKKTQQLFKDKAVVNVMQQYMPEFQAYKFADINRPLSNSGFLEARDFAEQLGLNLCPR